ncbi:BnaAnng04650D [Brassica napus]|uniref:BnaAnng04650D protein n=1 Tax=Brassica napus TaxID=3708 RepID=A0A078HHC9_BRANA|nr:BnaAnng04650D [Brassica napus]
MSDSYSASLFEANEETRVQTHFDVGANVEIASKDEDRYVKWYPGIVLKTYIRTGVEMLKVEYSTRFRDKEKRTKKLQKSVSIDSIRPQPLPGDTKGFELMDKVEAYHNDGCSTEFIQFNHGVWKMEKEIEVQQTQNKMILNFGHCSASRSCKRGEVCCWYEEESNCSASRSSCFFFNEKRRDP